ncbi:MAG: hypothetical protein JRI23_29645 [Deltaproteobacteria bacterium]|jgi:hypothetical protein|nr:hypothetical protein [Deltaproteobacteria bacterium]MBW2536314.1 hypothetical protein [Deltaproteobacteria bacterium]
MTEEDVLQETATVLRNPLASACLTLLGLAVAAVGCSDGSRGGGVEATDGGSTDGGVPDADAAPLLDASDDGSSPPSDASLPPRSVYYEATFENGAVAPAGSLVDGAYILALRDWGYVLGADNQVPGGGSGGFEPGADSDVRVEGPGTFFGEDVSARNVSYFLLHSLFFDRNNIAYKDYNAINGGGVIGDYGGALDKPRTAFSLTGADYVIGWDRECWVGFSVYIPASWEHDNAEKTNGSNATLLSINPNSASRTFMSLALRATVTGQQTNWFVMLNLSDTDQVEGGAGVTSELLDLGSIADDIGTWTDFVLRLRANPFSEETNPHDDLGLAEAPDHPFLGHQGILQLWKSTGSSRQMQLTVVDREDTPVGLVPWTGNDNGLKLSWRIYKYGWKKLPTDALGPVWLAYDDIRFGETDRDGTGYQDVHPDQELRPD